jgi:hypothetical protein
MQMVIREKQGKEKRNQDKPHFGPLPQSSLLSAFILSDHRYAVVSAAIRENPRSA